MHELYDTVQCVWEADEASTTNPLCHSGSAEYDAVKQQHWSVCQLNCIWFSSLHHKCLPIESQIHISLCVLFSLPCIKYWMWAEIPPNYSSFFHVGDILQFLCAAAFICAWNQAKTKFVSIPVYSGRHSAAENSVKRFRNERRSSASSSSRWAVWELPPKTLLSYCGLSVSPYCEMSTE